jgi:hypothetical protein
MQKKENYIKSVLVVFGLLIVSRIPGFISGDINPVLIISTIVEFIFLVWGIAVLRR